MLTRRDRETVLRGELQQPRRQLPLGAGEQVARLRATFAVRLVRRSSFALALLSLRSRAQLLLDPRVLSLGEGRGLALRAPSWNGDADRACVGDADQVAARPGMADEDSTGIEVRFWFRVLGSGFSVRGSGFGVRGRG